MDILTVILKGWFFMSRQALAPLKRRRASLSIRFSIWLMCAAIAPLLLTIIISEWQARPALTAQADAAMARDVDTRTQLIDTYFNERLLDAQTLAQVPSVQTFLETPPATTPAYQDLATHAAYALVAGRFRDKRYSTWTLFDPQGRLRLAYPANPKQHGLYLVPPEDLQAVQAGKTFVSAVYYSPQTQKASVDIYSPIVDANTRISIGMIRATLNLDYIWQIVSQDQGSRSGNGDGSYAFILDENGMRIADTQSSELFKAVTPLPTEIKQTISNEARYGTNADVPLLPDAALANKLHDQTSPATFQIQPAGKTEQFQVVKQRTSTVPWSYFVLSPVSTVTAVANTQLLFTTLIALAITLIAAIGGIIAGRRISHPIMNSVEYLRNNSQALSDLAVRQRDAASEQMWVVDSSQVGLQSVQYYTQATQFAARQLHELGAELTQRWEYLDNQEAHLKLERVISAAKYIEQAAQYQGTSNEKLATALKVATQVTEQLAHGATSATDAALQLEQVVKQLRYVVGK